MKPRALFLQTTLMVCVASLLTSLQSSAQSSSGGWTPFTLPSDTTGLPPGMLPGSIYFSRPDTGYLLPGYQGGPYYQTDDGGRTWYERDSIPVPFRLFDNGFACSGNGSLSYDGGETWNPLALPDSNNNPTLSPVTAIAGTPSLLASIYNYPLNEFIGVLALAYSTDGGTSWTQPDSVAWEGPIVALDGLHLKDKPPLPMHWRRLVAILDSTLYVVSSTDKFYLWSIDMTTDSAEWVTLPFNAFDIRHITDSSFYTIALDSVLQRSDDLGRSWNSYPLPDWVDRSGMRFFSLTYAACANAQSFDGGRTWVPYYSHLRTRMFFAADSALFYRADANSFFARSEDAGRTWEANSPLFPIVGAATLSGHTLLAARGFGELLRSTDNGTTWMNITAQGGLGTDLASVRLLRADPADADHILGVAEYVDYDSGSAFHVIKTTDGGIHWERISELGTEFSALYAPVSSSATGHRVWFALSGGVPYRSSDEGYTWAALLPDPESSLQSMSRLCMINADTGYAAANYSQTQAAGIWKTTDGGNNWSRCVSTVFFEERCAFLRNFGNEVMAVFPDRSQAGSEGTIYRSGDAGKNWIKESYRLNFSSNTMFSSGDSIFVLDNTVQTQGTSYPGLFRSNDRGHSIPARRFDTLLAAGDSSVIQLITAFAYNACNIFLFNGDGATGAWWNNPACGSMSAPPSAPDPVPPLASPNIAAPGTTIRLLLQPNYAGPIAATLHDIAGRTVLQIRGDTKGVYAQYFYMTLPEQLAAGVYFISLQYPEGTCVVPLRVTR